MSVASDDGSVVTSEILLEFWSHWLEDEIVIMIMIKTIFQEATHLTGQTSMRVTNKRKALTLIS